jgi:preprotein translocase subunit SecA
VRERGGLHVILTEFHDSRRVDRQLFGRCARQGDNGSCEAIVSIDDEVYTTYAPRATRVARAMMARGIRVPAWGFRFVKWLAQRSSERRGAGARIANLKTDRRLDQVLAFSGRGE